MNEFFEFFDELQNTLQMHLSVTYSHICEWEINIWIKGGAEDYPDASHNESGDVIVSHVQDCDIKYAFAKAYVDLKEWLLDFTGGY